MSNEVIGHMVAFVLFVIVFGYVYFAHREAAKQDKKKGPIKFKFLIFFFLGLAALMNIPELIAREYFPNFETAVKNGATMGLVGGMLWYSLSRFLKK